MLLRNHGAILFLMFIVLIQFSGYGMIVPIMPAYMNEIGMSGQTVGFLYAIFSITELLFSPIVGKLSDIYGRKIWISGGLLVFTVSEWMFGAANSVPLLLLSRFLEGLGSALMTPAVMAYVSDVTSTEERAKGMSYLNASISAGFMIGPGIGGFIAEYGIRIPFYSAAVIGALAMVVSLFLLPESLSPELREKAGKEMKQTDSLFRQFRKSLHAPYIYGLLIVFVLALGLVIFETIFGLYVDRKYHFSPRDIAVIITCCAIVGALVQVTVLGPLLNRFGEKKIICACLVAGGGCLLVMELIHLSWIILLVTFMIFLSSDILRPSVGTLLSKMAGEEQGFIAGMNSAYTSLGNFIGPIMAGFLFDWYIGAPYIFAGTSLLICFVMSMFLLKTSEKRRTLVETDS